MNDEDCLVDILKGNQVSSGNAKITAHKRFIDEEINHRRQIRTQKKIIFIVAIAAVIVLYGALLLLCVAFIKIPNLQWAILDHKHLLLIPGGLLVVPSFLLWGIIRGLYKISSNTNEMTSMAKSITEGHPET